MNHLAVATAAVKNRRLHARVRANGLAGHIRSLDASHPALMVENISRSGVFVRSAAPLAEGTRLMLELARPGLKRTITLHGSVASVVTPVARARGTTPGMGIRIDPVDADAARRLGELIASLSSAETGIRAIGPRVPAVVEPAPVPEARVESEVVRALEDEVRRLRAELRRWSHMATDLAAQVHVLEAGGVKVW